MWVDNDVPILKNFYQSPFSKWPPQYLKNSTLSDIIKRGRGVKVQNWPHIILKNNV
jgi:hypothetical protein